jgi:hypothetical protein
MGQNDQSPGGDDLFLAALDGLVTTLRETIDHAESAVRRADLIRGQRASGMTASQIIEHNQGPLLPETITRMLRGLLEAGSRLRRQEARALHDDGLSMEAIAQLFGVSRQRVSALLQSAVDAPGEWWGDAPKPAG